jgi:hypothetical protein
VADYVVRRVKEIWVQLADREGPLPDDGGGLNVAAAAARP